MLKFGKRQENMGNLMKYLINYVNYTIISTASKKTCRNRYNYNLRR